MKTCYVCGHVLAEDRFAIARTNRDGRQNRCKQCSSRMYYHYTRKGTKTSRIADKFGIDFPLVLVELRIIRGWPVKRIIKRLKISASTFYRYYFKDANDRRD